MQVVTQEERVISLYEICKVLNKDHSKSKSKAKYMHPLDGFGEVAEMATLNNSGARIETYHYTKKQALMIGARLDNVNIIKLVNKLEQAQLQPQLTDEEFLSRALIMATGKIAEKDKVIEYKDKVIKNHVQTIKILADLENEPELMTVGGFCKFVNIENMGSVNMGKWLYKKGYILKNGEPSQQMSDKKYIVKRLSEREFNGRKRWNRRVTYIGAIWLSKMLDKDGYKIRNNEEVA